MKKGALINFTKFTGKYLCQRVFLNKVAGLRCETLFKDSLTQMFSCEFCEISKNTFFIEHLRTTASVCSCSFTFILFQAEHCK